AKRGQMPGRIGRTGYRKRRLAPGAEHRVDEHLRHAGTMVPVKMRQQDGVDRVVRNAERIERDEAGGAEVDGEADAGGIDEKAGVEPAARAEGIARADKSESD